MPRFDLPWLSAAGTRELFPDNTTAALLIIGEHPAGLNAAEDMLEYQTRLAFFSAGAKIGVPFQIVDIVDIVAVDDIDIFGVSSMFSGPL